MQESFHKGLHICDAGGCFNVFEGLVNGLRATHFLLHLLPHEGVPEFINHEFLSPIYFGRVLIFTGGSLSNLCVLALAFKSALHRCLFVQDASIQLKDTLLPVLLFFLNVLHQAVKNYFALKTLFLGFPLFTLLKVQKSFFALQTFVKLGAFNFGSNKIFLHAGKHVLVSRFTH